jgi:ATP-dependent exoDNAse (exonuclease V) alpha subunit
MGCAPDKTKKPEPRRMATYHFSAEPIGRSTGRSSTAAAAYRSGTQITDERTGEIHDYRRKKGVLHSELILPGGGTADRAEFWNGIEKHHKRGDAVLVREIEISLPTELTPAQRQELAVSYGRELADRYGVAADVALHAPHTVTDKDLERKPNQYWEIDPETGRRHNGNWHVHVMLSACYVEQDGTLGKKAVELDPIHCKRAKIENFADRERERWCELANTTLELHGHDARIDHRTLAAQGIDREPGIHLGPAATAIERRGGVSDKTANHQAAQREAAELAAAAAAAKVGSLQETENKAR